MARNPAPSASTAHIMPVVSSSSIRNVTPSGPLLCSAVMFASRAAAAAVAVLEPRNDGGGGLGKPQPPRLERRINLPSNRTSPAGLIEANSLDPWNQSGKYALGMVYFGIIVLVTAFLLRLYHLFTDRIRCALHQEEVLQASASLTSSPDTDYELCNLDTDKSTAKFFPRTGPLPHSSHPNPAAGGLNKNDPQTSLEKPKIQSKVSSIGPLNKLIALVRYVFYRPVPTINLRKGWYPIVFPSLGVTFVLGAALIFVVLYTFLPRPLYWSSLEYGAPPVAVRSGMLAVALMPWIVAFSMKANFVSLMTGIGHERLNVLHRWGAYICLFLSLVHTVPFYVAPGPHQGRIIFEGYFFQFDGFYIYGTGIAALVPLGFLCLHSLPQLRHRMYEVFVALHVPVAIVFLAMLFWHCHNYLSSWHYLFATVGIWVASYIVRLFFYLNWFNPFRISWLVGEEAAVTILPENALKITIPTQVRWRPGQYVYLRMPGISVFENHPFTVASLCSEDFPSEYGEGYRDMVLVFRPFGGFTAKVLKSAVEHGPWHTYRAFIDGPYGGMKRRIEAFDQVILIAGGSGITAIVSQLLDLIKRMRDGKAVTKTVNVIWALQRPETMEWFKEELRICREFAPPDSVHCRFFVTAAKRVSKAPGQRQQSPTRPVSMFFHDRVNHAFQGVANKRASGMSERSHRHSALIQAEAAGDPEREKELRREDEDAISALPRAALKSRDGQLQPVHTPSNLSQTSFPPSSPIERSSAEFPIHSNRSNTSFSSPSQPTAASHETTTQPDDSITSSLPPRSTSLPQPPPSLTAKRQQRNLALDISTAISAGNNPGLDPSLLPQPPPQTHQQQPSSPPSHPSSDPNAPGPGPTAFDFGFPSTPTEFQKNLMRFAFFPATTTSAARHQGWSTEYGRPDIPYMLRSMARDGEGLGNRTCVLVCGPPAMRVDVCRSVAELQMYCVGKKGTLGGKGVEEVFLHAENYAI